MPSSQQLAADRAYLVQLAVQGDIHNAKAPADMTDAYAHRLAAQFHKQEALHLTIEKAPARGHARGEHGRIFQRVQEHEFRPAAYEAATKLLERPSVQADEQGRVHLSAADLDREYLEELAEDYPDLQMFIDYNDTELFTHGGIKPESLLSNLDQDFDGNFEDLWEYWLYEHENGES